MSREIKYLSLCGMLGYGYPEKSLKAGLEENPDFIAVDNGSTDPGPYYLGSGNSFLKDDQILRDLEPVMLSALNAKVPLIIGSAGGSGAKAHVDHFVELLKTIAENNSLHFKLGVIYADIAPQLVIQKYDAGKISPCSSAPKLNRDKITNSTNLVGQMGTEPIIDALKNNVDILVVGRCCDTAIFAALPIMQGFDPGLAMHSAKIAECGTLCTKQGGANDSLIVTLKEDHFIVKPTNPDKFCTIDSVAAHSLYEQPHPEKFVEPEGTIDLSNSHFEELGDRSVRVSGTRLVPPEKITIKLEGAELKGYRCITIAGTSDPTFISRINEIQDEVRCKVSSGLSGKFENNNYQLRFIRYGLDALGENSTHPQEIGLLIDVVADTPEFASTILSLARSTTLHQGFTGRKTTAGNLAFPFSPSDLEGGAAYDFSVYHLMEIDSELDLFPVTYKTF